MRAIVVSGPESSGKTTLCQQIGNYFHAPCVLEYARSYIGGLNRPYTYNDVEHIAREQYETFLKMNRLYTGLVVFDTYLIVTRVWFTHKYKKVPDWLDQAIRESPIEMVFLCYPDLPFEPDPLRENEFIRKELYEQYRILLEKFKIPYLIIQGTGPARLESCLKILHELT